LAEFSNPNQQGGQDNKSLVTMMFVVIAVLFGAQYYHSKVSPQQPTMPAVTAPQTAPAASEPGAAYTPSAAQPEAPAASLPKVSAPVPSVPVVQASAETTTVVENELYRITFSNRGGQVTSWILKQSTNEQGKPLDIVPPQAAKVLGYPLSLYTYDGSTLSIGSALRTAGVVTLTMNGNIPAGMNGRSVTISGITDSTYNGTYVVTQISPSMLTYTQGYGENGISGGGTVATLNGGLGATLNQAMFVPSATGTLTAPASLSFEYSNGDLHATKTFTFDASYVLHATVLVTRSGVAQRALLSWPSGFSDQNETSNQTAYSGAQFDSYANGSLNHVEAKKVTGGGTVNGPFDFAGVADMFFAAVFMPDSPGTATAATLNTPLDVSKTIERTGINSSSPPTKALNLPVVGAAAGDVTGTTSMRIFVGPKAIDILKAVHPADSKISLSVILEFGFWGIIGKGLFLALHIIHDNLVAHWHGSWGWAIVLLTVLINLLILPFRVKTMQSALHMQRIQPQMDVINAKYKKYKMTDPKQSEKQAEVSALQKEHGVNPLGGCIPSLVTMPLIIAFYSMLPRVVELRNAHWLWITNLQNPDPLHILPIAMMVSQFLVQFYTPSPGIDPQQQKMMAFMMPGLFGYISWTYGAGLALYLFVGNIIGIVTQMVMNRTSLGREMREIAAKRARRKKAASTTIQARR
jgi:YidC/Oxa1 family membrane protein insertase